METKFNFKSQLCTDKNQSERLLALGLKKETADCNLNNYSLKGKNYQDDWQVGTVPYSDCLESWRAFAKDSCWELIPAWSLHRLLMMTTSKRKVMLIRCESDLFDVLIRRIEHGIKEGHFNKDYLEEKL